MDMNQWIRWKAGYGPDPAPVIETTPRIPRGFAGAGCGSPPPVVESPHAPMNRWLRRGMLWTLYGEHEVELGGYRW